MRHVIVVSALAVGALLSTAPVVLAQEDPNTGAGDSSRKGTDRGAVRKCEPGLLFDANRLTCNYGGLVNPE